MLYPEDSWNLERVKNSPEHLFFKQFGESMPKGDWHHPGTKQGIYMIGPNAEYLEGKFAAGGNSSDIVARMNRALSRWESLRKEKGYANAPIPSVKATHPPEVKGDLILRINSRDLPRRPGDQSGRRISDAERQNQTAWPDFTQWAWNESWIGLPSAVAFVPNSDQPQQISASAVRAIARTALVDNVRGQNPDWRDGDVKSVAITMQRIASRGGKQIIRYTGSAQITDGNKAYAPNCYGEGIYDPASRKFDSLDLVWLGIRTGAAQFNQRERDRAPAPMGITLSLFDG